MEEAPIDMSEAEARALARKNGYGLVELLRGALNMDGVWRRSLSVRNCSNAMHCDPGGIDIQAFSLISKIAYHIQADGAFPEKVCYVK